MSSALRHLKGISEHLEAVRGVRQPRHLLTQLKNLFLENVRMDFLQTRTGSRASYLVLMIQRFLLKF